MTNCGHETRMHGHLRDRKYAQQILRCHKELYYTLCDGPKSTRNATKSQNCKHGSYCLSPVKEKIVQRIEAEPCGSWLGQWPGVCCVPFLGCCPNVTGVASTCNGLCACDKIYLCMRTQQRHGAYGRRNLINRSWLAWRATGESIRTLVYLIK